MARDKRGHPPEPDVDEVMDELVADDSEAFIAGPTARNEAGDTKRAVAKATGQMSASKMFDPDLAVDPDGNRPKSGSKAAIHSFQEVPPEKGVTNHRVTRGNAEIVDAANIAARKAPAGRAARVEDTTGFAKGDGVGGAQAGSARQRMPAPGNRVSIPKGQLIRSKRTASSIGEEKPAKRSAHADGVQGRRMRTKGDTQRD